MLVWLRVRFSVALMKHADGRLGSILLMLRNRFARLHHDVLALLVCSLMCCFVANKLTGSGRRSIVGRS